MDRRSFFRSMVGGVAAAAAVRTFPFRVFSFPSTPKLYSLDEFTERYVVPAFSRDAQYSAGVLGKTDGFDWYTDVEIPVLWVPRESIVINSWTPGTGQLVVTRGMA